MKERQEPEIIRNKSNHIDETHIHPAFGQISASRVSSSPPGVALYGSDFLHQHFMTIRIYHSELNRSLSRDWHFAREVVAEVALSEAQWATFVSSPNAGSGVPCTVEFTEKDGPIPGVVYRNEEEATKEDFKRHVNKLANIVSEIEKEIEGDLGSSLSKVKKDKIVGRLQRLKMEIASNTPFIAKSFDEHMEKTIEHAKIEVEAYLLNAVQRAGVQALHEQGKLLQLGSGDE